MPVHPTAQELLGLKAYPAVTAIPGPVDLVIVVVPSAHVETVVDDCLAKGVRAICVISAGFGECSEEGRVREQRMVAKARAAGCRIIGPNCMGLLNTDPNVQLNATFSPIYPPAGSVAMSTQSGALGLAILDYAKKLNIGISSFVSVGNKADVSGNDLLGYWETDPRTSVILLYLESFGNPAKFSRIARRISRQKPIVALKSGRSAVGARAAASHTGALASSDSFVDALFHQSGVIRTDTVTELFDVAMLLSRQPLPRGRRVAILTNAGGPGILAADACQSHGLEVAELAAATKDALRDLLPAAASVRNPVDMLASAPPGHYEQSLRLLLADPKRRQRARHLHSAHRDRRRRSRRRDHERRRACTGQARRRRLHAKRRRSSSPREDSVLRVSRTGRDRDVSCREVRRVAAARTGCGSRTTGRAAGACAPRRGTRARTRRRLVDGHRGQRLALGGRHHGAPLGARHVDRRGSGGLGAARLSRRGEGSRSRAAP